VPLNPDVFSRFIDNDPNRKPAEADVRQVRNVIVM
jgi:hypothetical protein